MAKEQTRKRLQLILLAMVFLGPLAVSFFLYYSGDGWRPGGSTVHGELLTPRLLSDAPLFQGKDTLRFRSKWSMVYAGDGDCNEICRTALYQTRQIRRSLGRDMDRVQRVYMITSGIPDLEFLEREHPGLIVVSGNSAARQDLLDAVGDFQPGDVFLVDPIGNLMMRFPRNTGMKGIKEDLVRLLKVSHIG